MKKLILFMTILSSVYITSQNSRQKVIVEVGTGTWCPSCPEVVHIIEDFISQSLDIAVIEYHINDPYTNTESIARENYYDFPWFPTTYYDSNHIGIDDWATQSAHFASYNNRLNTLSSFDIAINNVQLNSSFLDGSVTINKVDDYAGLNLKLQIVLTESNISQNWQGETELDFVERAMFPTANGTSLDFTSNGTISVPFNISISPTWVNSNLEIVYFIQDDDTKEILQGDSIEIQTILGTNDFSLTNTYIYPNPSNKEIFIANNNQSTISNISIFDLLGKKIIHKNNFESSINIEKLPLGIYLISYFENDIKKTAKLIKN